MSYKFKSFLRFIENPGFKTSKEKLKKVVDNYNFIEISDKSEINNLITNNMKESKVIIINHYKESKLEKEYQYFVVSFKQTILVINQTCFKILQTILSEKEISFLTDTKKIFDESNDDENAELKIKYIEIAKEKNFEEEIDKFNSNFYDETKKFQYNDILLIIKSSISGYLIKQSYYKNDKIKKFNDRIIPKKITEKDIIELRVIGKGNVFEAILYYHIEYEKLVLIKKYYSSESEIEKLLQREIQNYNEINHFLIPKFYGTIQDDNLSYPVIEFINGNTLFTTDFSQFSEIEIYEIIFQMLLVINYLHNNHFIYRDLKPDNVIIDQNKSFFLIDFDRIVKDDYIYDEDNQTTDFPSSFSAPEINSKDISNKSDIYSIGKIINFIMSKNEKINKIYENTGLKQIFNKCFNKIEKRPNSSELINEFIFFIKENIDVNKSIYYFSLVANQNDSEAQYNLGVIYYLDQNIPHDINKSIYNFSLAANQNHSEAQFILGIIYYEGQYVSQDIAKSIYYYSLAANQNHSEAQCNLGLIYYEDQYISRDIDKSIYYLSLSANQNISDAQYILGLIYYEDIYILHKILINLFIIFLLLQIKMI